MPVKHALKAPSGALYILRAIKVVFSDWKIFRLAIMPMFINIALFAAFFASFNYFIYDWVYSSVFAEVDMAWYWDALYWLGGAVLFIISIAVVFFGFVAVGLIVAAPFNEFLSAAVERKLTGSVEEAKQTPLELGLFIMKNESKKIGIILLIQISIALIAFVPVVGQAVFMILTPLFLSAVMAFEFTGYTLDRRGLSFKEKRAYLQERAPLAFGFGLSVAASLMIPIINFALLPLAVTGGAMLVVDNPPSTGEADVLQQATAEQGADTGVEL